MGFLEKVSGNSDFRETVKNTSKNIWLFYFSNLSFRTYVPARTLSLVINEIPLGSLLCTPLFLIYVIL